MFKQRTSYQEKKDKLPEDKSPIWLLFYFTQ